MVVLVLGRDLWCAAGIAHGAWNGREVLAKMFGLSLWGSGCRWVIAAHRIALYCVAGTCASFGLMSVPQKLFLSPSPGLFRRTKQNISQQLARLDHSSMAPRAHHLRQGLDKEVYQVVLKLLSDDNSPEKITITAVYDAIKRSNSSLKRKPKIILEDSIERILSVMEEDRGHSDSEDALEPLDPPFAGPDMSNAMNRALVKQWTPAKGAPNGLADATSSAPVTADEQAQPEATPTGKKKKKLNGQPAGEPSSKRVRVAKDASAFAPPSHVTLADLGGMDSVIEDFKEYLMLPLKRPERYMRRGLKIPRGILLHGPPGCGKTMLCEAVANELGLPWLPIAAPSIVSGMSGESEKQLRQHFETAIQMAPCLMFIDEIDAITPKREGAQREMERRIVAQFLTCMDSLALEKTGGKPVIVLAATNRPDSLDPALRRAGRFDTEINIGVPNGVVREQILRAQTRKTEISADVDFARLAKMTPGFVGADLESLIYKAGSASNARYLKALKDISEAAAAADVPVATPPDVDMDLDQPVSPLTTQVISATVASFRQLNRILDEHREPIEAGDDAITMSDFLSALPYVQPSSKREGFATIPDTTWSNIGALHSVRQQLHNAIVEPIRRPEKYERFGISVPAGVLLWGPPGCGKTLLAKAVANESKANFISVKGPELLNKYVGESERAVRQVFFRARSSVPCVIFFDELDALVPRRDDSLSEASARVVNTLLTELDGISTRAGIYVIGATNRPDVIDPAMLRPGRLGKHLYVGPPGADERVEILATLLAKMPVASGDLAEFARANCDKFSGADLSSLAHEAAQKAVERDAEVLEFADLELAVVGVKPSVGDLGKYEKLLKFGLTKGF